MLRFIGACIKANWKGAMEFRAGFLAQVFFMLLNNGTWIVFWWLFFDRFNVVAGWTMNDILQLWAFAAGAFGWINVLFGNCFRLAGMIAGGELDVYLGMPKPVLLHAMLSRTILSAYGDLLFAVAMFFLGGGSLAKFPLFLLGVFLGGWILVSLMVMVQSLAFWIGNAEGLSLQFGNALLTFTTYPTDIFHGVTRVMLFTVLPAGFISIMPIRLIREFSWEFLPMACGVTILFVVLSVWVFHRGLKRYESGNQVGVRM